MISSGARFLPSTVVDMRLLCPHNMLQPVGCKQTYRAAYSTAVSAVYVKLAFLKVWARSSQTTLRGTHSSVYACCFVWWVFVRWHCSKASLYAWWDHYVSDGRAARSQMEFYSTLRTNSSGDVPKNGKASGRGSEAPGLMEELARRRMANQSNGWR